MAGGDDLRLMWDNVAALLDDTTITGASGAANSAPVSPPALDTASGALEAGAWEPAEPASGALEAGAIEAGVRPESVASPAAPTAAPAVESAPAPSDPFYLRIFRPSQAAQQPAADRSPAATAAAGAAVAGAAIAGAPAAPVAAPVAATGAAATSAAAASAASQGETWQAAEFDPPPATGPFDGAQTSVGAAPGTLPDNPLDDGPSGDSPFSGSPFGDSPVSPAFAAAASASLAAAPQPITLRIPGSPFALPDGVDPGTVTIRGRNDGVSVEIGAGPWPGVLNLLSYRLEQSSGFFRNGHIAVDLGSRNLNEYELSAMRQVMVAFEMDPSVVRTAAERTFQAALALGMAATQVAPDGSTVNEAQKAIATGSPAGYYIYRGSLRSGQVFYRHEHVIIMGDVNPGAEVVSDGDILVWGRLRGTAHAGARGNAHSVVGALDLDPVQLRIDRVIGAAQAGLGEKGPRWGSQRTAQRRPEIARLVNGRLVIEAWDEIRSTGSPLLKSRRN